jgi:hypothetical protein
LTVNRSAEKDNGAELGEELGKELGKELIMGERVFRAAMPSLVCSDSKVDEGAGYAS